MAKATRKRGFQYFGGADPSKSAPYAGGLHHRGLALCDGNREELEAKAIFRLLNFCPPESFAIDDSADRLVQ
jgi:hypothetical protein